MRELIGQRIGDYEVLEETGRGAMGIVYKARQYSLDRIVALKVLAPELARDEAYVERFKREAIIAATLNHRNIVGVYEAGAHLDLDSGERVHYFAMEYIEGETVQRRLARQDRIPADEVAAIGVRAAQGLAYAWKKARVIHRDIKPSNIFLTSDGEVKVADLGLARVSGDAQASLTATGAIIGTAYYMSPEQVRGESDIDFRSDIYSLGCTLYRMLCGQHLYEGAFASVIVKHLTEPPPSIRMVMPDCPMALVKVIEKMLAKHPSGRHQSYQELIEELRQAHEQITSGSMPVADEGKVAMPASRKRMSLVIAGVAAVVVVAGLLWWAPWQQPIAPGSAGVPPAGLPKREPIQQSGPATTMPPPVPASATKAAGPDSPTKAEISPPATSKLVPSTPLPPPAGGTPALPAQTASPAPTAVPAAPAVDPFVASVAALSLEQQVARVVTKLKELNTSFDGKETHKIENGAVTELAISTAGVTDISPLAALKGLKRLSLAPSGQTKSPLTNLTPLKGLSLTALWCHNTSVRFLYPLENMPLTTLTCGNTMVDSLASLRGMPLTVFSCDNTPVEFLSPLEGMPLTVLWCNNTKVTDLSPLQAMPLQELKCDFVPTRDAAILRGIETLTKINDLPAAAFWKRMGIAMPLPARPLPSPDGFQPLFNGKDLQGWIAEKGHTNWWSVIGGELVVRVPGRGDDWLLSAAEYSDFILKLEFKMSHGANSGVALRAVPNEQKHLEIQLADESTLRTTAPNRQKTGALYNVAIDRSASLRPFGSWNDLEIEMRGSLLRVSINGQDTLNTRLDQLASTTVPLQRARGKVGLQAWEGTMSFRNIRIKDLSTKPAAATPSPQPPATMPAIRPTGAGASIAQPLVTSVGMELVPIPPGEFMLGSTAEEQEWAMRPENGGSKFLLVQFEGERPRRAVIRRGFWLGRTEVTVGQWKQFVDATTYVTDGEKAGGSYAQKEPRAWANVEGANWKNPRFEVAMRDDHPVCCISWNDAMAFCAWLDEQERAKGRLPAGCKIRLPTEAEWEYACRAGTQTKFWWGDAQEDGEGRLNWSWMHRGPLSPTPVDSFGARGRNRFGLADMLGNVWEWCLDGFDSAGAHTELWTGDGSRRVVKGGALGAGPGRPRCAFREGRPPSHSSAVHGFRVCCGPAT